MNIASPEMAIKFLLVATDYEGDKPPIARVYSFYDSHPQGDGKKHYAAFQAVELDDMAWANYIKDPVLLADAGELTLAGHKERLSLLSGICC